MTKNKTDIESLTNHVLDYDIRLNYLVHWTSLSFLKHLKLSFLFLSLYIQL